MGRTLNRSVSFEPTLADTMRAATSGLAGWHRGIRS